MKAVPVLIAGGGAGIVLGLACGRGMLLSVAGALRGHSRFILFMGAIGRLTLIVLGLLCAAPFGAAAMAGVAVGTSVGLLGYALAQGRKQVG